MIAFNARYFAMTNMTNERADILISHVVDGEATAEQWRELEAIAAQNRLFVIHAPQSASPAITPQLSAGDQLVRTVTSLSSLAA